MISHLQNSWFKKNHSTVRYDLTTKLSIFECIYWCRDVTYLHASRCCFVTWEGQHEKLPRLSPHLWCLLGPTITERDQSWREPELITLLPFLKMVTFVHGGQTSNGFQEIKLVVCKRWSPVWPLRVLDLKKFLMLTVSPLEEKCILKKLCHSGVSCPLVCLIFTGWMKSLHV